MWKYAELKTIITLINEQNILTEGDVPLDDVWTPPPSPPPPNQKTTAWKIKEHLRTHMKCKSSILQCHKNVCGSTPLPPPPAPPPPTARQY